MHTMKLIMSVRCVTVSIRSQRACGARRTRAYVRLHRNGPVTAGIPVHFIFVVVLVRMEYTERCVCVCTAVPDVIGVYAVPQHAHDDHQRLKVYSIHDDT